MDFVWGRDSKRNLKIKFFKIFPNYFFGSLVCYPRLEASIRFTIFFPNSLNFQNSFTDCQFCNFSYITPINWKHLSRGATSQLPIN